MKRLTLILTIIFLSGIGIPLVLSLFGILKCDYHCDFVSQQIAFVYEFKRMLGCGTPWWSWNTYLGDNFLGEYSYYCLFSPFTWLCCLFPFEYLNLAILISIYLKTILTGIAAYTYLRGMKTSEHSAILGGVLYAFSSFYIINLFYGMFSEAIMIYPLLLIGIENVLARKKYSFTILVLITFLTVTFQYYCSVASMLCAGIYILCRILCVKGLRSYRNFFIPLSAMLYGIALSSIILIPTAMHIIGGNRNHFEPMGNILSLVAYAIYHIFWSIIPKISESLPESFPLWLSNSTSLFIHVTGLSFAIIYTIKNRTWLSACIVIYALLFLTPLNGIFTLFSSLSYCRWLYCFILMVILATAKCIDRHLYTKKEINIYIVLSLAFILFSVALSFLIKSPSAQRFHLNIREAIELTLALLNLLTLYWLSRNHRILAHWITPAVTFFSTINTFVFMWLLSGGVNHNDASKNLMNDFIIDKPSYYPDKSTFSRTDYISPVYTNLSLIQNAPSLHCFHSLFNKNTVDFINYTKKAPIGATSFPIKIPRESLAALLSVKDVLQFNSGIDGDIAYNHGLTVINKTETLTKYTFDYSIPMGMVYDSYITKSQLDSLRAADKDANLCLMMLDNIVIEDTDESEINKYLRKASINTDITLDSIARLRNKNTIDFSCDANGYRLITNASTRPGMAFISTPRDDGFSAKIDDTPTKIFRVNMGMSGITIPPGKHEVIVTYTAPGLKFGAIITIISFMILLLASLIESRIHCN